jgi:Right handed beta helix region
MPFSRNPRPALTIAAAVPLIAAIAIAVPAHGRDAAAAAVTVKPGANLNAVYHAAKPGQEILLAPGNYGDQKVSKDRDKRAGSARVTFRAQGQVTFSDFETTASHVEYVGFRMPGSDFLVRAGRDVVIRNAHAAKPYIWGPRPGVDPGDPINGLRIIGGDFGPEVSCEGGFQITSDGPPRNVTIDGATFHDFRVPSSCPDAHLDCLHVFNGINGLTVRNSRFYRCEHFGMLVNGGSNITIENNFLNGGIYGFKLRGDNDPSIEVFHNVLIRNNSADEISLGSDDSNTLHGVRVQGNATVQRIDCRDGAQYSDNLAQRGSRCGRGDLRNVGSIGFANPDAGDFHISRGSPAVDRVAGGPAEDFDGDGRPQGARSDVGADEVARPSGLGRIHALLLPVIRTARHILHMTVRGFLRVRIACRAKGAGTKPRRCSGVVGVLRSHSHFTVRTGHARFVKVRLRRSVRRALRRHPMHAVIRVKVRARGHTRVARKRVLLARLR